jgi:transcriptional regulator with GAF, ATPase, and Fis domain
MGLKVRLHPEEAVRDILDAFARSKGRHAGAASQFGVTVRTLDRWVARLGLQSQVETIKRKG